jgi:hypothetical protein
MPSFLRELSFAALSALGPLLLTAAAQAQVGGSSPDPRLEAALRARLFDGTTPAVVAPHADPDSTEWEQARSAGRHPDCADVGPLRYLVRRADLNGDGQAEQLAVVVGSYACGSRGCTLMIFRESDKSLELVAENGLFQSPLQRLASRHAGWSELGMPGSRDGVASGWLDLAFDGLTYRPVARLPQAPAVGAGASETLLTLPPLPFERVGHPLTCRAR